MVKVVGSAAKKFSLGDTKPLIARVTSAVNKLVKMGVNKEELMSYFEHAALNDFTEEEYTTLIGIGTSLRDGMIKAEELFVTEKMGDIASASDTINDLLASKREPSAQTINAETGEVNAA